MKKIYLFLMGGLLCALLSGCAGNPQTVASGAAPALPPMRGADISYLDQLESLGTVFTYKGTETPLMDILAVEGLNWVRLRLWVDPAATGGWCDLERTVKMATRAQDAGFKVLLCLHYSDWWADPASQTIPASWQTLTSKELANQVHSYTAQVLKKLIDAGAAPDMVQVGNEIGNGMLWPEGRLHDGRTDGWQRLSVLLGAGIAAVREADPRLPVMLHTELGGNPRAARVWYAAAQSYNLDYDVIGLSYYPVWHGTDLDVVKQNLTDLSSRFDKDVCIVETSYPWTLHWQNDDQRNVVGTAEQLVPGFPATAQGQSSYLAELARIVASVPNGRGVGLFWWEPASVSVPGFPSSMENLSWFDFSLEYNGTAGVLRP